MDFDIVIVGAGPAGLATAIRLKQLGQKNGTDPSVVVLEKGSEVGAHILSGAVIDPIGLNRLLPDWKAQGAPLKTPVTDDRFLFMGPAGTMPIPGVLMPGLMSNHGNYIGSLGALTRWLAEQAEALGVDIYPGFSAAEILYGEDGEVRGVATGDMGVASDGSHKDSYTPGMELCGKYTIFAEGARGQLAKQVISHYGLDQDCEPQKFGLGIKELWQVDKKKHRPGLAQHTMGWPLNSRTGGGSFLYHFDDNLVSVGFVVHLNYENPWLSPFDEFQRFKTHPAISELFEGATRLSYGARVLTEGGYQSVPRLAFPGGALVGCAAGFMNVPRIKGSHNAILSGILAAEAAIEALAAGRAHDTLDSYQSAYHSSDIADDLHRVRNVKPLWSKFGTALGVALGGIDMWMNQLGLGLPKTLSHGKADFATMKKAKDCKKINYPKPDGKLTFDKLSSVYLSSTNHEENQPVHLTLADTSIPLKKNLPDFAEPAQRYCPAGVYEVIEEDNQSPRFVINSQNCVHCKTCDIKDPAANITWVAPEGGGGPNYQNM